LKNKVVQVIDVSYGGENGLNEAITLASEALNNVKFVAEKKLVSKFFEQIALDTGMIVFGIDDTIKALELSALETIMLYEDIEAHRYVLKHPIKGDTKVLILTPLLEKNSKVFGDAETQVSYEVVEREPLAEWICNNYSNFGAKLEFITDKSQEGF
jgi:peptide chain release factor subunit 1